MAHGGARPNAGRKKGSTNAKTALERAAIREKVEAIKSEGETPLEVLLRIMRSSTDEATVIDCAKAAAPFIHPKLQAIEHSGDPDKPVQHASTVEFILVDGDTSLYPEEACAAPKTRPL